MQPIDIFIGSYLRAQYTDKTIEYLLNRTNYPYRLFLIDQGGNQEIYEKYKDKIFLYIKLSQNIGVHAMWNLSLSLAESNYFITTDNDIFAPDLKDRILRKDNNYKVTSLQPDWLSRLVGFMDERPDYGAISLHPHIFIGAAGIDPNDLEDVKERNMCGAVLRILRREAVYKAGGWERKIEAGRNHEESTICSRLQTLGYKVGICSRIRAYHPFGKDVGGNWGYPKEFTPEQQKHNPALEQYVQQFDNMDAYDNDTWLPK